MASRRLKLPPDTTNRLVSLVTTEGLSLSEALRRMEAGTDGAEPIRLTRKVADRLLADVRRDAHTGADVPTVASRMLALASQELDALERQRPTDLDRLHKLASTVAVIDRMRPKPTEDSDGLLALQDQTEPKTPRGPRQRTPRAPDLRTVPSERQR